MTDWHHLQPTDQRQILESLPPLSYRSPDLSRYLHDITCGVSRVLNSDWSIVTVYEGSRGQVIASNLPLEAAETEFAFHDSLAAIVVQTARPFFITDCHQHPEVADQLNGYTCYLGVPLRTLAGEVIGTICSFSAHPQSYAPEIMTTVEQFAERAATAIDNYRLYQQQRRFNDVLETEITRRTMELSLAQAKLIEHERLATIGEFAAMIVHEIRNPLTTVQMGLDYFAKLDLPQSAQDRLALARDEAKRLTSLLQEILSYAKPQILQLAPIEINSFIQELLYLFQFMPEAQGRAIEFTPCHSPVQIWGDPDKLKQVFMNLIRNACEAVEPGDTIRWSVMEKPLHRVCISIHNGGEPIPTDVLHRVTQPFYSTKADGTGLGLAIVKRIVEAHSGELLVESSLAHGTTFQVQLPLQLG